MRYFFLDTSCLVKRYAAEPGSEAIAAITQSDQDNAIFLCDAAGPELVAALTRRARGQGVEAAATASTLAAFRQHWRQSYRRIALTATVIERAMVFAEKHGLRGYDAVHLGAAVILAETLQSLDLPPLSFVSADLEQLAAAEQEGLTILNPGG